ncbi:MAG TPA: GNAT family N-acetyltransferase [Dehalococcoidia bacterium]|jgi:CelD/BcsL family acetyltransferase involved in cellulose biosynthesis
MSTLTVRDEPFERVSGEWAGLLEQTPSPMPFITPAWQRVWLEHFQGDRELRVYTARDGERLIGVAPMLLSDGRAELVGHYSICDYMDVAVTPGFEQTFIPSLLERLADDGAKTVEMRGLREISPTVGAVCACAPGVGYGVERQDEALAPVIDLPSTWDEYLGALSKKDRHELRRKMRRLEGAGGVSLRVITEPGEASEMLDTLFNLMRISSHHKEEFLDRPGMVPFFRDITRTMAAEGMLRFYFLEFDGQPVASVLNFDVGGTLYMYNSGYDPAYAHYAVGLMSKTLLVRDAIEAGRSCVDFLRGDESYKYDLGGKDKQVYRVVLTR